MKQAVEASELKNVAEKLKAQKESEQNGNAVSNGGTAKPADNKPDEKVIDDGKNKNPDVSIVVPTEDEIISKWMEKEFGGKIKSPAELKALLTKGEPTEDDKKQLDKIREQAVMQEFLATNSKEDYDTIIKKSSMSDMDLVYQDFLDDYKDVVGDLDEKGKRAIFDKKYNLVKEKRVKRENGKVVFKNNEADEPDDVEEEEIEDEKLSKLSKERIKRAANRIREKLKSPIVQAENSLKGKFAQSESEATWQKEVEETFPQLNVGKYKFSFGEGYDDVEYDVPKEILDEVKDEVKNPKKFASLFIDDTTKKTDKQKLTMLLLKSKLLDKFAFSLFRDGESKGAKKGTAILPSSPDFSKVGQGNANGGGDTKEEKLRKSANSMIQNNPKFRNLDFSKTS